MALRLVSRPSGEADSARGAVVGVGEGVDCESPTVEVAVTVGPVVGVGDGVGEGVGSLVRVAVMVGTTVGMGDAVDCRLSLMGVGVTDGTAAEIGDGVDCESPTVEVAVTVGGVVGMGDGVGEGTGSLPHAVSEKTATTDDTTIAETRVRRMIVVAFDSRILSPLINGAH